MSSSGFTIVFLAIVVGICYCQDNECASPTNTQLQDVIGSIIEGGDNSGTAVVELMDYRLVCRAFGQQQSLLRLVSVVVQYSCTGHANCPSGTATEQIETGCVNGQWDNDVRGSSTDIRSETTEASLSTVTRDDCSFCLSPELVAANNIPNPADSVTHCVACDSSCDKGLMQCYGVGADQCCSFYHNSDCVDECPSPFMSNSEYVCVCPVGTTGVNCEDDVVCDDLGTIENGMVTVSDTVFNSTANYSCNTGYVLAGDAIRTCQGSGLWSGSEPTCTACSVKNCAQCEDDFSKCQQCADGYNLSDDECKCPVTDCESCDSDVNKCDICGSDKVYDSDSRQCIIDPCSVKKCAQCEEDDFSKCQQCADGYNLSDDECKCPVTDCESCDSDVNKCDVCGSDKVYDSDSRQCIIDPCSVKNCTQCEEDDFSKCQQCADGYNLSDDECKCPVTDCESCDSDVNKCDVCGSDKVYDSDSRQCIIDPEECECESDCASRTPLIAGIIVLAVLLAIAIAVAIGLPVFIIYKLKNKVKPDESHPLPAVRDSVKETEQ